jgi:ABC-type transport system involved in cytochrome c biogenesis permease subunit
MVLLKIYPGFLCVMYALTVGAYAHLFFRGPMSFLKSRLSTPFRARVLLVTTLLCHLALFPMLAAWHRYTPVSSPSVALSALALSLTIAYFLIEWITAERNMGAWVLALPFVFQVIASVGLFHHPTLSSLPPAPLVGLHVGVAMIGYCAFTLSAAFSAMYLLLYRQIKNHHLGLFFERLPSLEKLEQMGYRAIHFGLGFLLAAIALGEQVFYQQYGRLVVMDSKILIAAFAVAVYATAILLRKPLSIQGKRFAVVSILGFLIILFSLFFSRILTGFHRFD